MWMHCVKVKYLECKFVNTGLIHFFKKIFCNWQKISDTFPTMCEWCFNSQHACSNRKVSKKCCAFAFFTIFPFHVTDLAAWLNSIKTLFRGLQKIKWTLKHLCKPLGSDPYFKLDNSHYACCFFDLVFFFNLKMDLFRWCWLGSFSPCMDSEKKWWSNGELKPVLAVLNPIPFQLDRSDYYFKLFY